MTKIRAYESAVLADNYNILSQMLEKLNAAIEDSDLSKLKNTPPSVVPTETIYNIAVCYSVMYDALVQHELLNLGQNHKSKSTH